jgi:TonB family protein
LPGPSALPTAHHSLLAFSQASPQPQCESILAGLSSHGIIDHFMSLGQVNSGYNLLGQGAATAARMAPIPTPPPEPVIAEPKLDVPWGDFRQSFASSVRTLFSSPFKPGKFLGGDYFRDCWVERRMPWRAVVAAALLHVAFVLSPFSLLPTTLRHNSAFDNTQLTWSGPIEDFPTLQIRAAKPKAVAHGDPDKLLPPKGADAFHPRQHIVTDPVHPNHPRQTLLNPVAPQLAPKTLPDMPNIVQLQAPAAPARPHIQISAEALAKLHPRQHHVATVTSAPPPDVLAFDQKPADLTLAVSPNAPARPKLDLNAGAAPRVAERAQTGDTVAAPEISAAQPAADGNPATLIALSASPAAPKADVQPPQGNLAAHISISPEGTKPGVPDGSANAPANASGGAGASAASNGGGKSPVGISISGGNPQPKPATSGLGGSHAKLSLPSSHSSITRPDLNSKSEDAPERTGPPDFATLTPGAKPEQIFAAKRVYTLAVNMANINSASGSWVLHFAELGSGPAASAELAMPVPVRKVDPKFPPELIEQNVQGEVVLYGIVHADGSVDSIQIARGLEPQLDANAKSAFAQWKFQPGSKSGTAVDLEVIAHIPFKIRDDR